MFVKNMLVCTESLKKLGPTVKGHVPLVEISVCDNSYQRLLLQCSVHHSGDVREHRLKDIHVFSLANSAHLLANPSAGHLIFAEDFTHCLQHCQGFLLQWIIFYWIQLLAYTFISPVKKLFITSLFPGWKSESSRSGNSVRISLSDKNTLWRHNSETCLQLQSCAREHGSCPNWKDSGSPLDVYHSHYILYTLYNCIRSVGSSFTLLSTSYVCRFTIDLQTRQDCSDFRLLYIIPVSRVTLDHNTQYNLLHLGKHLSIRRHSIWALPK